MTSEKVQRKFSLGFFFEHSASHKHKIQSSFYNPLSAMLIFYSSSPHQYFAAAVLAFPKSSDIIKQYQQKSKE